MKKIWLIVIVCALSAAALQITPFQNVTSAKLKGCINSVMWGESPSCYPGNIYLTIGALDYQLGLDMMVDPLAENAIWQTVLGVLAPGALSFEYSVSSVATGADVVNTSLGAPWEMDLTELFQAVVAGGQKKPYAFCFMVDSGPGKMNLLSSEATTPYSQLIGVEVQDVNGANVFKYNNVSGTPINSISNRIQYTGQRTIACSGVCISDAFIVGGFEGGLVGSTYEGRNEQRCAFFFHRGLAAKLGWHDPLYPNDTFAVATEQPAVRANRSLSLQNTPNPFTGVTRVSYTLEQQTPVHLAVYTVSGRLVQTLANGTQAGGAHNVSWDGCNAPRGVYIVRLKAGIRMVERKMVRM